MFLAQHIIDYPRTDNLRVYLRQWQNSTFLTTEVCTNRKKTDFRKRICASDYADRAFTKIFVAVNHIYDRIARAGFAVFDGNHKFISDTFNDDAKRFFLP